MDKTISLVNEKVEMFNQLYNSSEKLQKHLSGLERIIHIQLEDAGSFYLSFGKEGLSKAVTGEPEQEAHITIISTTETLNNVLTGKEKKMKAIVTKKIKLKAKKLKDLLLLKKLLSTKLEDLK